MIQAARFKVQSERMTATHNTANKSARISRKIARDPGIPNIAIGTHAEVIEDIEYPMIGSESISDAVTFSGWADCS